MADNTENNINNNFNQNNSDNNQNNNNYRPQQSNTFATVAIALGIISILSLTSIIFPLILGSLAIIFAILSKGSNLKMSKNGFIGFTTGITSIVGSIIFTAVTIYMILFNQDYRDYMNEQYKSRIGVTFDEYVEILKDAYNGELSEESLQKLGIINDANPNDLDENFLNNLDSIYNNTDNKL